MAQSDTANGSLPDTIANTVNNAVNDYRKSALEAAMELLVEFDTQANRLYVDSRLTSPIEKRIQAAADLVRQKEAFIERLAEPDVPSMQKGASTYRKRIASSRAVYEQQLEELAKTQLVAAPEWSRTILDYKGALPLESPLSLPTYVRFDDVVQETIASLLTGSLHEELSRGLTVTPETMQHVIDNLAGAMADHSAVMTEARESVLLNYASAKEQTAKSGTLSAAESLARMDMLEAEQSDFLHSGLLPADTLLPAKATKRYYDRVAEADKALRKECAKLSEQCVRESLALAYAVLAVRDSILTNRLSESSVASLPVDSTRRSADIYGGEWQIKGEEIIQSEMGRGNKILVFGSDIQDYDVTVEGIRLEGGHALKLVFHFADSNNYRTFCIGNYNNKGCETNSTINGEWQRETREYRPGPIEDRQWYTMRVEVRGSKARCFLDGEFLFEGIDARLGSGRVGLASWDSIVKFRNMTVCDPSGRIIWSGLPSLE